MKKFLALFISAVTITGMLCQSAFAAVQETNLSGIMVSADENPPSITYADGTKEVFPKNIIALFINGSIIKNANIVIENDRTLVPLRLISETLGAKVNWDGTARKVTISDGNNKIELVIGSNKPTINGKVISIDVAPKIFNDYTYVPLRFIAESLNCKVDWFDGKAIEKGDGTGVPMAHYVLRIPQVMVSRYPVNAPALTASEAIKKLQDQLVMAYETQYNTKFQSLAKRLTNGSESDGWRYTITNLSISSISSENDRFYTVFVGRDFMIDKYTGTVLWYYNGQNQTINKFNPKSQYPLNYAG